MSNREIQPKKLAELICEIKDSWDYLYELTNGEDDLLSFASFKEEGSMPESFVFFHMPFINYKNVPLVEFPNPREISIMSFYLDYLNTRIAERERELLDFAIEHNLSYLERLLSSKGRKSALPLFFRKKQNKVFVSREFTQWAELSRSYLESYSEEKGLSLDEAIKEIYLAEIVREIEEMEKRIS
ncbi:MAG: hypothetical protein QXX68_02780 [Candidatus Pacearchaeota archaeon]